MQFEIFRTGKHTSDKGITKEYSLDDLNFIATSYNPGEDEAPIVIGHPKDNDPAFGWVSSLSVSEDGKLFADAPDEKLHPDFLKALQDGSYKKRSISLTPEGKLRHVGFLGAAKPAVKGLADIQFTSESSVVYEFDELNKVEKEKETIEAPIQSTQSYQTLNLELKNLKDSINALNKNFSESELASTKDSISKINSQLQSIQSKLSNSDFSDLLDDKVSEGTLTPAIKEKVLEISNFMLQTSSSDGKSQNFSEDFSPEGFQSEVNKKLVSLVNAFPKIIFYENFAEKPEEENFKDDSFLGMEVDTDSKQLHKKALALMKKDSITYLNAVTKLIHN